MNPFLPNKSNRRYPVTTGGATSGKAIMPSRICLPCMFFLANIQPSPIDIGNEIKVLTNATLTVSHMICISSMLKIVSYINYFY